MASTVSRARTRKRTISGDTIAMVLPRLFDILALFQRLQQLIERGVVQELRERDDDRAGRRLAGEIGQPFLYDDHLGIRRDRTDWFVDHVHLQVRLLQLLL